MQAKDEQSKKETWMVNGESFVLAGGVLRVLCKASLLDLCWQMHSGEWRGYGSGTEE